MNKMNNYEVRDILGDGGGSGNGTGIETYPHTGQCSSRGKNIILFNGGGSMSGAVGCIGPISPMLITSYHEWGLFDKSN